MLLLVVVSYALLFHKKYLSVYHENKILPSTILHLKYRAYVGLLL